MLWASLPPVPPLKATVASRDSDPKRDELSLKVIGAGLGRTGTTSLRDALSRLFDGPCYHFEDVIAKPSDPPLWRAAIRGERPNWEQFYDGYVATTDWPGASFWKELSDFYPDSLVLLSCRRSTAEWFDSVKGTIEALISGTSDPPEDEWLVMAQELLRSRFVPAPFDKKEAEQAYERHNALVRSTVAPSRLIEWTPGDGWEPLCQALGLAVPDIPFPHQNTKAEFRGSLAKAGIVAPDPVRRPKGRDLRASVLRRLRRPT